MPEPVATALAALATDLGQVPVGRATRHQQALPIRMGSKDLDPTVPTLVAALARFFVQVRSADLAATREPVGVLILSAIRPRPCQPWNSGLGSEQPDRAEHRRRLLLSDPSSGVQVLANGPGSLADGADRRIHGAGANVLIAMEPNRVRWSDLT